MTTLIPIDGSQGSREAVRHVAAHHPGDQLVLVHVAPSAREGDLARGRFVLEEAVREARAARGDVALRCRLEIGSLSERIAAVAAEDACDRIVIAAHGTAGMTRLDPAGDAFPAALPPGIAVEVLLPSGVLEPRCAAAGAA